MRRILVIATRQIGDVLLTTPVIRAARQRWPEAKIDVLGFQGTLGMLAGNNDISERIETPARLGWRGFWRLVRQLWRRYDLALVTQPGDRAHLLGFIAAQTRSGLLPEEGGSNWWKRRLLAHAVPMAGDRGDIHVTVEKLALLAPWSDASTAIPVVDPPEGLPLPAGLPLKPGYAVVHAPSMWAYKQWPLENYAEIVRGLLANGVQVALTGSGGAHDQACVSHLRTLGTSPMLIDASGQLNFSQLKTLLEGAAVYIGPDTSVSHLAAATGTPTIAVFGPTNPARWAPWPAQAAARDLFKRSGGRQTAGNVTVLQGSQACVPCGRAGCEDHRDSRSDCLLSIPSAAVLDMALKVVDGHPPPPIPSASPAH